MGRVVLLLVDPQNDFHDKDDRHPAGSLQVPGSSADSKRIAAMIREHIHRIDDVYVTMDSHHRNHIAHAVFWTNARKESPEPFQIISAKEVEQGLWFPRDPSLRDYCKYYTKALEERGNFQLQIWPEHCLIGSEGHGVVESIHEALMDWVGVKFKTITYIRKGGSNIISP